jgi:glyoxylase-like metal-dependent hydrolase (beta-lactamase superfamily II)
MAMLIHHLNCRTLRPPCARLINGDGGIFSRGKIVCHCLLIETNNELILVDTGIGQKYIENPKLLGGLTAFLLKPSANSDETATGQIARIGLSKVDFRHIVLTHLDFDHAGGLGEFPNAQVHVLEQEYEAAMNPQTRPETGRYIKAQWGHGPKWRLHTVQGQRWYEFDPVTS